jgi:TolB-like protein/Tfp pilus assembly protein PilF
MPASPKGDSEQVVTSIPGDVKPRLNSWKEIASYFNRDVRTVQLWERKEGLPIHRHEHSVRASVYAYPSELDVWFKERARKQAPEPAPPVVSPDPEPAIPVVVPTSGVRRGAKPLAFLLLAAFIALAGWLAWRFTHSAHLPVNGTLVVLPFLNLTGDSTQDYLSDGITDELTTLFASQLRLQVVARTSAFQFKGRGDDVRTIGQKLGAAMVLEGSLENRGNGQRINAQLVRSSDGYHLWSHLYDSPRGNTFAAEQLIVSDVAHVLKLAPSPMVVAGEAGNNAEAHAFYLQGMYWYNHRSPSDEWKAIAFFNQAIDREPLYARAYLGLALAYAVQGVNGQAPPGEAIPKAREAAEKALQIDPKMGEAQAVLAHIQASYDWNYGAAEKGFRQAVSANPSFVTAHHWFGLMLMYQGRFAEAEREYGKARELDPLSPVFPTLLCRLYLYAGRYDEAIKLGEDGSRDNPSFPLPHYALGQVYLYQGKFNQALAEFEKYYELSDHDPDGLTNLALAYALMGNHPKALELLNQINDPRTGYSSPYNSALIYAGLGDKEQAYAWLDKAIEARSPSAIQLLVDPAFRTLRPEPRFQQMLRRTGH